MDHAPRDTRTEGTSAHTSTLSTATASVDGASAPPPMRIVEASDPIASPSLARDRADSPTFSGFADARANNFDFVRFVLASIVVLAHGFHALNRTGVFYDPLLGVCRQQDQLGHLAVYGFFAVSGCLVTASRERSRDVVDYFRKRVLRIYPGFIIAWLICALVVAPLSGLTWQEYRSQVDLPRWILKIVMLRGFGGFYAFPHNAEHMLNTSLWTIPFEFGCYVVLAIVAGLGWLKPKPILVLAGLVFVGVAVQTFAGGEALAGHAGPFAGVVRAVLLPGMPLMNFFMMGAAFHVLRRRIPYSAKVAALALATFVVSMRVPPLMALTLPICGVYLLFYFAYHPSLKLRGFARHADLSYGIYLYGWPAQQMIARFFESSLNGIGLFVVTMPVVCMIAYCSWRLVEEPMLRLKQRQRGSEATTPSLL